MVFPLAENLLSQLGEICFKGKFVLPLMENMFSGLENVFLQVKVCVPTIGKNGSTTEKNLFCK